MHAARQPGSLPGLASRLHYERHRPEQTTLYRLVQQHAASFIAHTEASTDAELPRFIKDEFDAFLECSILAASAGDSVRRAAHGACRRRQRIWWTTSSRTCRYGNECSRRRCRCACCWPRSPR